MKASNNWDNKHILISRTDSIGDVLLTLPMTAWLKEHFPNCIITFLCKGYTSEIIKRYSTVDHVLTLEEIAAIPTQQRIQFLASKKVDAFVHVFPNKDLASLAKKAKIETRIGTSHRTFHLLTCNVRPNFTRKKSALHEAQLNFELLRPFGISELPSMDQLNSWTTKLQIEELQLPIAFNPNEKAICLHPKSQGSAKEWPIDSYMALAKELLNQDYTVYFTGTDTEGASFRGHIPSHPKCIDTTGKLSLPQLMYLISKTEGLVACSTGPLHIAGFFNRKAIGLFSPRIPIHPGRWRPLGTQSIALVKTPDCPTCKQSKNCQCITEISVDQVITALAN